MEKSLYVTGVSVDELLATISLVISMSFRHDIISWGLSEDNQTIYFNYEVNKRCPNLFPIVLNEKQICDICWNWFEQFKPKEIYGDGSTGKGWTVKLANWGYDYQFSVEFTTMYYGK